MLQPKLDFAEGEGSPVQYNLGMYYNSTLEWAPTPHAAGKSRVGLGMYYKDIWKILQLDPRY